MPTTAVKRLCGTRYFLFYTDTVPGHTGKPTGRTIMARKREIRSAATTPKSDSPAGPKTVPASKVGLSLTISEKTLKDFDRIQEKTIKAVEKDQNFSWG